MHDDSILKSVTAKELYSHRKNYKNMRGQHSGLLQNGSENGDNDGINRQLFKSFVGNSSICHVF